jgi:hypothetical protein
MAEEMGHSILGIGLAILGFFSSLTAVILKYGGKNGSGGLPPFTQTDVAKDTCEAHRAGFRTEVMRLRQTVNDLHNLLEGQRQHIDGLRVRLIAFEQHIARTGGYKPEDRGGEGTD